MTTETLLQFTVLGRSPSMARGFFRVLVIDRASLAEAEIVARKFVEDGDIEFTRIEPGSVRNITRADINVKLVDGVDGVVAASGRSWFDED